MKIIETNIADLKIIEAAPISDHRGSFSRWFCARELESCLNGSMIVQVNESKSLKAGTVRGLHFQNPPLAEKKLVRCIKGSVWDVAVDLRSGSPTFLKWYGHKLTAENQLMMIISEGFAHGYQALEPDSELLYLNTAYYEPKAENGLHPEDPRLSIKWPLPVENLSQRDSSSLFISDDYKGITV